MDSPLKVFLAYAPTERELAKDLASRLDRDGFDVWLFDRGVSFGENYARSIGKALDDARAMIVLISPEAARSRSVLHEIAYAIGSPHYENRVVPVVVRPTQDLPWILKTMEPVTVGDDWDRACERVRMILQGAVAPTA